LKKLFIKTLAAFNAAEGIIHLVVAAVSFWGMYAIGVWDWRIMTAPTADVFLGFVSLITGFVLNRIGDGK
jgi:hypothetical protein